MAILKKFWWVILLVILVGWTASSYNGLVTKEEQVVKTWADVETQYQRRSDLIGNLVNTVKGAADYEKDVLTSVVEARAKATSMQIDESALSPENIQKFQAAQQELSGALSRLLVSVERYPQLQAVQAFRDLQVQLEGTENRIAVARTRFNDVATTYNTGIRKFPAVIMASMFGFERKGVFEADKGAENAPEVDFGGDE